MGRRQRRQELHVRRGLAAFVLGVEQGLEEDFVPEVGKRPQRLAHDDGLRADGVPREG